MSWWAPEVEKGGLAEALQVTPGASQTRSKAPGQLGPVSEFPLFALGGDRAWVYGDDGNRYLDCFGANAAIPLGYGDMCGVRDKVGRASATPLLSMPHAMERVVSRKFLDLCAPWAESVRWVKTGSEAMSAAVRLARIQTGRTGVVVFDNSYHGWHDWTFARFPELHEKSSWPALLANGVPARMAEDLSVLPYGRADLSEYPLDEIAAVVVEGHRFEGTTNGWLSHVAQCARAAGAVLIFDEMVYGLRWANGGFAEVMGIQPDLACFGKALGNGFPVACVCGTREVMQPADRYVSGTYGGDTIGLAAAEAVLDVYKHNDIIGNLRERGNAMWNAFQMFAHETVGLVGFPVHWKMDAPEDVVLRTQQIAASGMAGLPRVLFSKTSNNASAVMSGDEAQLAGMVIGLATARAVKELRQR